jgi:predicted RNA binding protein YcfA (HicA-like mRNA interferase family)
LSADDDLLKHARSNPGSLPFRDFEKLMESKGWTFKRQRGSHRLWYSPTGHRLPIQPKGRHAKAYQVKQFLAQYDKEHPNG